MSAAIFKRSAPQAKRSSSEAILKRSAPRAQHPSSEAPLKRSAPQAERSSSEAPLKRSDHFPELIAEVLARGRDVRFRAPGRSMYPAIREGETITVRPLSPDAVKVGDIILYRWEGGVIAHRVIRIVLDPAKAGAPQGPKARSSPTQHSPLTQSSVLSPHHSPPSQSSALSPHHVFVLRGDASGACDERVKPEQILGKVVVVDRNGRSIDLYSISSKVRRRLHPIASRFKQWARDL